MIRCVFEAQLAIIEMPSVLHGPQMSTNLLHNRDFCITENEYFCLFVPATPKKGDLICVLLVGEVPYVLRKQAKKIFGMVGEW